MVICIAAWRPILVPYSYEYVKMVASHVSNDTKRRLDNELLSLKAEWKFYELERKFGQHWCHENEDRSRKDVSWLTVMINDDFVVCALVPCVRLRETTACQGTALVLGHSIQTFSCHKTMIALISGNVSNDTQNAFYWECLLISCVFQLILVKLLIVFSCFYNNTSKFSLGVITELN